MKAPRGLCATSGRSTHVHDSSHGSEPPDFIDKAGALTAQRAPLLRLGHVQVACFVARQMLGKLTRIAAVGLDLAAVLVPVLRPHHVAGDAQGAEFALQCVA